MKKIFVFALFSFLTMPVFSIDNNGITNDEPPVVSTDEIPENVLAGFYGSFIEDSEGNFLGAKVGEMKQYLGLPEILTLISNEGYAVSEVKVIDRHKPRFFGGGCKYKDDWICQFEL
ncbi:MAG: hypothetical protein AAFZ15_31495 [Bacteroidota bacterium]